MKSLFSLWEDVNPDSFYLEENKVKYLKKDIDEKISILEKNLNSIADCRGKIIYLDIKERFLFIAAFLTILKIKAEVVLVPYEVKIEDYFNKTDLFITDNKKHDCLLFLEKDFKITPGINFNPENIEGDRSERDAALFLYTSGSTGKAKLIPKTSFNLISEVEELKKIFNVDQGFVFYFTPPICHIYGLLFDLLLPIHASAKIILDYHFTPESIANFVSNNKIDFFISIPSYYRMFVDLNLVSAFKNCRILTNSSAPLPQDVSKNFFENNIKITEVYGSTETGGIARRVSAENPEWKIFSYVKIIREWTDYLDGENSDNEIFELKVDSPAISVSYDKNSGFNTGDVIKFSGNNFILLGRNTRFVKISGKRVDLGYVFEKVKEYLKNSEDAIIKDEELYIGEYNNKIYALYEKRFKKNTVEIKKELRKHLPGYAVPRIYLSIKIPRNNMGKINRIKIEEILKKNQKQSEEN